MPTKQTTFDTVVAHLRKQGPCISIAGGKGCLYRGQNGTSCAAGCLIPDNRYSFALEGHTVKDAVVSALIEDLGHDVQLVSDLQSVHDNNPLIVWEIEFELFARSHGLTYTPPTATVS